MPFSPQYNPLIHNRKTIRLRDYDYSQPGLYFITLCCHNREHLFGHIHDSTLSLNDAGKIADDCWLEISNHFPNAILHEFIIMPNHVHRIIELKENLASQLPKNTASHNPIQPITKSSISSIIRSYKTGVTKWFRNNTDIHTVWQSGFHDHIIRSEQSYQTIAEYITTNPERWEKDIYNK